MTLRPGDLIATGTPAGASGAVKVGDVTEITIEGIGTLRNRVVGGWWGPAFGRPPP